MLLASLCLKAFLAAVSNSWQGVHYPDQILSELISYLLRRNNQVLLKYRYLYIQNKQENDFLLSRQRKVIKQLKKCYSKCAYFLKIIYKIYLMKFKLKYLLIAFSLVFFILGRLCDNLAWYSWKGITTEKLEGIAIAGLGASAILAIIIRLMEQGGWKVILFHSQIRFVIAWALVILEAILVFNIFGCYRDNRHLEGQDLTYVGCSTYSAVVLLSNLNYSLSCNNKGQLPFLIVFQIVLFAEIIFNGHLLIEFVNTLEEKPKDYSILFISIMIAWQVLVMDLIFRAAYEDKHKQKKHIKLEETIHSNHEICRTHHRIKGTNSQIPNSTPVIQSNNVVVAMESSKQINNNHG